jgi:multiple RNA-binding domain-containing protein 1
MSDSSSRIIVKNIPKYATPEMVKKHFSKLPGINITDVKIMKTPSGQSRRFCFIGFLSENEASRALEYYNKSFFDTCRVEISVAKRVGSSELPRSWSKHTANKITPQINRETNIKTSQGQNNQERAAKFLHSLESCTTSSSKRNHQKAMLWGNDDLDQKEYSLPAFIQEKTKDIESDSDYEDNHAKLAQTAETENPKGNSENKSGKSQNMQQHEEISVIQATDDEPDIKRLFVRNLTFTCSKDSLLELFSPFGPVDSIHIPLSKESKFPKGIAFVTFGNANSALDAYEKLDGTIFQGRLLHILPAKKSQTTIPSESNTKKEAPIAPHNPLFMKESNTTQSMALHLGVKKEDFLTPNNGSLAVRLAVSEASLVNLQKKHLEDNGVNLEVLEMISDPSTPKSDTCLVCKNIPPGTTEDELSRLMGKYGRLCRFVFSANSSIAICEYIDSSEARKAYNSLLGSNFRSQPLMLNWSPLGTFKEEAINNLKTKASSGKLAQPEHDNIAKGFSLYVKNLSFHTSEQALLNFLKANLSSTNKIRSVRIPKKQSLTKNNNSYNSSEQLSLGFGFVEFETSEACKLALDKLQGTVLDGHQLEFSFSNSHSSTKESNIKLKPTIKDPPSIKATRLLVKNVPFEATEKELRELFASFVQIRKVRLPKKFGGQHRGFAFVDCATHQEARDAFGLLGNVHLYGRHLVIEWALEQVAEEDTPEASHPDDLVIYE